MAVILCRWEPKCGLTAGSETDATVSAGQRHGVGEVPGW